MLIYAKFVDVGLPCIRSGQQRAPLWNSSPTCHTSRVCCCRLSGSFYRVWFLCFCSTRVFVTNVVWDSFAICLRRYFLLLPPRVWSTYEGWERGCICKQRRCPSCGGGKRRDVGAGLHRALFENDVRTQPRPNRGAPHVVDLLEHERFQEGCAEEEGNASAQSSPDGAFCQDLRFVPALNFRVFLRNLFSSLTPSVVCLFRLVRGAKSDKKRSLSQLRKISFLYRIQKH